MRRSWQGRGAVGISTGLGQNAIDSSGDNLSDSSKS